MRHTPFCHKIVRAHANARVVSDTICGGAHLRCEDVHSGLRVFRHAIEFVVPVHRCLKGFRSLFLCFHVDLDICKDKQAQQRRTRPEAITRRDRSSELLSRWRNRQLTFLLESTHIFSPVRILKCRASQSLRSGHLAY